MLATSDRDGLIRRWWVGFGVALFFLLPLDLLTTLAAVAEHGLAVEANPIMRWLLDRGLVAVTAAHLVAVGLAVALFEGAIRAFSRVPPASNERFARGMTVWLGVILAAGVTVTANNLATLL